MFDLNVLCIGQETPTVEIAGIESIWIEAENEDPTIKPKFYGDIAPVMNYIDGIWYMFYEIEWELGGTHMCYIKGWDEGEAPFWVGSHAAECVVTLLFREENVQDFKTCIQYLIEQSPIHTVIVLPRFQSDEQEIILGTFLIDDFFKYLAEEKLLSNVCYVVSDRVEHKVEIAPDAEVWLGDTRIQ